MFRRYLSFTFTCAILIFASSAFVSAQTGQLRGSVVVLQADGTSTPAVGAAVVVYRTDIAGKYEIKTNKTGEFAFAGLPLVGTYLIAVSHTGAQPTWIGGVKVGRDIDYKVEMPPGDGRAFTEDEIKSIRTQGKSLASSGTTESKENSDDKAKRAELEKKNAEIMEKNKKAEASNATVQRTFKAGNEFLKAKDYDQAIAQFDEGLSSDPDHPGAPSLMTNKSAALRSRAVNRFNAALKAPDDATKKAGLDAAKKDWRDAYEISSKAVEMLKGVVASSTPDNAQSAKTNLYFALLVRAEAASFFVSKVDSTQAPAGITAYEEYIAAETDAAKKAQAHHALAQMLFDANDFDQALAQYQKILATNPDDLVALLRSGQALFNIGALNNDKAKYQQAADFLAQYVAKAPDSDALKSDAQAILETLKAQENVKPASTPTRRRRP
ncbi:MAG TPA: tetratricopeptide repeat protein [Pyrinomonadaceae bacterium]|nr:tetratricopeptide repeat protein [Pyrinomonadaceae bacterium]